MKVTNISQNANLQLINAIKRGKTKLVRKLIKQSVDINACDTNGMTPLMYAADNGRVKISKILLKQKGINPSVKSNVTGFSAFEIAFLKGRIKTAKEIAKNTDILEQTIGTGPVQIVLKKKDELSMLRNGEDIFLMLKRPQFLTTVTFPLDMKSNPPEIIQKLLSAFKKCK